MDRRNFITSTGLLLGSLIVAPKIVLGKREIATIHPYGTEDDPFHDMIRIGTRPHVNVKGELVDMYIDPMTETAHQLHVHMRTDLHDYYREITVLQYWRPNETEYRPKDAAMVEGNHQVRQWVEDYRDKYPSEEWGWARIEEALEKQGYKHRGSRVVYSSAGILDHRQRRYEKDFHHKVYVRYYPQGTPAPGSDYRVKWTSRKTGAQGFTRESWTQTHQQLLKWLV